MGLHRLFRRAEPIRAFPGFTHHAHVSVYLPGRKGRPIAFATEGPIELTPARMKLLAKLVEPDQWRRNLGSRRTNWEAVEAAVAKAVS